MSEAISIVLSVYHLRAGNPLTGTMTKSEDPDVIPHKVAFHQDLHCLLRHIRSSENEIHIFLD